MLSRVWHWLRFSVYAHAFSTTMIGIFWITQWRKVDAGYPPEWDWIVFVALLTVWDAYEWWQRLKGNPPGKDE